jgi:ribulose-5-phosphate 4-epimerase/fuculose-1-phosphate aldolase
MQRLLDVADVMRELYERGWITTRDGNISVKAAGSDSFYVTPSGVVKYEIRPGDMVSVDPTREHPVAGEKKPSGEIHMHMLLQSISDGGSWTVIHAHPTNVVAAMYAGFDLSRLAEDFPELGRNTRVAPNVGILPATSVALGEATLDAMTGGGRTSLLYDIVGQDRHGVAAVARTPWEAFEHVERLEHCCEIVLKSGVRPS